MKKIVMSIYLKKCSATEKDVLVIGAIDRALVSRLGPGPLMIELDRSEPISRLKEIIDGALAGFRAGLPEENGIDLILHKTLSHGHSPRSAYGTGHRRKANFMQPDPITELARDCVVNFAESIDVKQRAVRSIRGRDLLENGKLFLKNIGIESVFAAEEHMYLQGFGVKSGTGQKTLMTLEKRFQKSRRVRMAA